MELTSKQRAQLRGLAATEDTIVHIGKGGITENIITQMSDALKARELVKGRVLETSGLTAREASDAICEALGAEGIACVGTKFVIWRKSEKVEQEKKKAASKKPAKKVSGNYNPVKAGLRARKQAAEQRPGCTDDDIERGDGRKQIRDQAAKREADRERGFQRDERAKGFGNPELDVSVGKRRSQNGDGGIQTRNETVEGNLA